MTLEQTAIQYKKAVGSLLGQEDDGSIKPFKSPFDKAAFGDKDIHDLSPMRSPPTP